MSLEYTHQRPQRRKAWGRADGRSKCGLVDNYSDLGLQGSLYRLRGQAGSKEPMALASGCSLAIVNNCLYLYLWAVGPEEMWLFMESVVVGLGQLLETFNMMSSEHPE